MPDHCKKCNKQNDIAGISAICQDCFDEGYEQMLAEAAERHISRRRHISHEGYEIQEDDQEDEFTDPPVLCIKCNKPNGIAGISAICQDCFDEGYESMLAEAAERHISRRRYIDYEEYEE
ncbi:hypothetical protein ABHN11_24565 [Brevibacillus centrosporus]|uniref:hypothetical protein n=1 Tax=Brevibacillus centrosporus TaxID=54910 RepID=UPI003D22578B